MMQEEKERRIAEKRLEFPPNLLGLMNRAEQEKKKRERQERLGITPSKPKSSLKPARTPMKTPGKIGKTPMKTSHPARTPMKGIVSNSCCHSPYVGRSMVPSTPSRNRSYTIPAKTPSRTRPEVSLRMTTQPFIHFSGNTTSHSNK